ncbi:MAG: hypothetical protein OXH31_06150 [Gammaproteobacteria bacterium]|nr:hypothetical protein [Gammaproteobacteria bacterium]
MLSQLNGDWPLEGGAESLNDQTASLFGVSRTDRRIDVADSFGNLFREGIGSADQMVRPK